MFTFVWFFAEFEPCSFFLISTLKTTEYAINVVNIVNPITFVTVLCLEGFVFSKRSLLNFASIINRSNPRPRDTTKKCENENLS